MDIEFKQEKVMEEIGNMDWYDDKIPEIMEGFINSPLDAIEHLEGRMTEEHINYLFDLFGLEDEEDLEEEKCHTKE